MGLKENIIEEIEKLREKRKDVASKPTKASKSTKSSTSTKKSTKSDDLIDSILADLKPTNSN